MEAATFNAAVEALRSRGLADNDIRWSESIEPPSIAEDFALEAAFVICNSGMKNTVARKIYEKVEARLLLGGSAQDAFGHPGKARAIDKIWMKRDILLAEYCALENDLQRLEYLETLPWIGGITKYHLAKNFGLQVAKPDVHLQRVADRAGMTAQALCETLAGQTGYKVATVDLLIWRACAEGVINSRTGELRP